MAKKSARKSATKNIPLPPGSGTEVGTQIIPRTTTVAPKKHWRGLLHMWEFYVAVLLILVSTLVSWHLLTRNSTAQQQVVTQTAPTPPKVNHQATATWPTYTGGFFSFKYPPTWQVVESTPEGFAAIPNESDPSQGKLFTNCSLYLQIPEQHNALLAIDIHDRTSNTGQCWNFGYFFDTTKRPITAPQLSDAITVQKWIYPYAGANNPVIQRTKWQGDYFQHYEFLGTEKNISFGLLSQENNTDELESDFDRILASFTFISSPSDTVTLDEKAQNDKRRTDIKTILTAVEAFKKKEGFFPPGIPEKPTLISTQGAKICQTLVPKYLPSFPVDPAIMNGQAITSCADPYNTGYQISLVGQTITVSAPYTETEIISISQ